VDGGAALCRPVLLSGRRRAFLPIDPQGFTVGRPMPHRTSSFFHLHLVSDSTGETLITVARAACAQYVSAQPVEHVYPAVRTNKQLDRVLTEIESSPGVILYTLLDQSLIQRLEDKCRELGLPCLSILGPVLSLFQSYLGAESTHKVGAQHILNADYFKRIDALNYTMMHDDGQLADDLENADVILVGVSRTSKTPTSIYLANRGVKTANIPLVPGMPTPSALEAVRRPLVVGLFADPAEPAARPQRPPRRRSVHRSPGGRRGDRVFAAAVQQT
jgi:regulator of PEP synthase PpsR (kinase-PPPase family)